MMGHARTERAQFECVPRIGRRPFAWTILEMVDKRFFDELGERVAEAVRASPAQDLEKNLRALLASFFARLDLVVREDFEVQKQLLERAEQRLAALEARLAELEARNAPKRR